MAMRKQSCPNRLGDRAGGQLLPMASLGELPTTYASLRDGGFKRLVCVRRTVSHIQEPFTLPFVPKVSVLAIFYPIRWLTPTEIHLPLSLRFKVGDFFRKDVKQ
ncbi:hypothetical protein A0V43_11695 [Geobacillus sp. JS12]|nr:hypothetical protein A0V43_11695 [Geobacillus sp. JS12]